MTEGEIGAEEITQASRWTTEDIATARERAKSGDKPSAILLLANAVFRRLLDAGLATDRALTDTINIFSIINFTVELEQKMTEPYNG